jgi:hypothetical protein
MSGKRTRTKIDGSKNNSKNEHERTGRGTRMKNEHGKTRTGSRTRKNY